MRDAFLARGHDAVSCDFEPTERPGPHHHGDVFDIIGDGWDLMIAHPPCTFLANSSSKHLYIDKDKANGPDPERWEGMRQGAEFFKSLWLQGIPQIAIENPIMLGYAKALIGCGKQTQTIQPYHFGDGEQKATCLWLKNLPPLQKTYGSWEAYRIQAGLPPDAKPDKRVHKLGPSPTRWKERSRTYPGIARAFAEQWG